MPKVTFSNPRETSPRWAQEELDRHSLVQGGGHLVKSSFTLPNVDGINVVYSGTLVGRTYAQKLAGTGFHPFTATDEQVYLVVFDVDFDDSFQGGDGHCSLYRWNSQVRETELPGWATMSAANKAKIRELYQVI